MRRHAPYHFLLLLCFVLASCTGIKHLQTDEKLYTGAKIELESADKVNESKIRSVAAKALKPAPNKKILWMRPKLWLYMTAGDNPNTKLGKWLRKKGEPPVLLGSVKPGAITRVIDARLFNIGIFRGYCESKIAEKKHTGKVIYTCHIHKPFILKDLKYFIPDDNISQIVQKEKKKSLLRPGEDYDLDLLKAERTRIDMLLKNNGYFYFNPDYLVFKADTSNVNNTVSLKLTLKDSIPDKAITVWRLNNIFIDQNYSLNEEIGGGTEDTTGIQNSIFSGKKSEMNIRPGVILRSVYLEKNEIYSRQNHNITLNRLMSMGNFKFVQVKFSETDSTHPGYLDTRILMTPLPEHMVRTEFDLVTKSNNYTGPRMNVSYLNRNTFNGAELLDLNMAGSFEIQLSGKDRNLFSYSFNPQVGLTIPRFIAPFRIRSSTSLYIPKTTFSLSFNFLKRVHYFDMRVFNFTYGFKWKGNIKNEHELNSVNVEYTSLGNQSAAFLDLLTLNPFLKKSYEEQFITGSNYSFTYNEQVIAMKKMQFFFQGTAETAGNLFSLAKITGGERPSKENPSRVFGSIYSQYVKFSADLRAYLNLRKKDKFAMRAFAGIGRPYGNSSVLPYTRQFFSGGPNSLRAFRINSVGPGTTFQNNDNIGFLNLGGEIKIELNAEYRLNIYRFLNGALFVDAGNVWLQKSNPANTGSPFMFSTFINEMAIGTGVGLRIDVSFFVLRLDVATPLKKPWLESGQRWVVDQINFANSSWRKDNLIFNIALGYPF